MLTILSVYSVLIFVILSVYSKNHDFKKLRQLASNLSHNECVNCSQYSGKCKMNTTGWRAFRMSKKDKRKVFKLPSQKDGEESLARCVVDGYTIVAEIETYICFWAPYMGCQGVASKHFINKQHMHPIICQRCAEYCGCKLQTGSAVILAGELAIICLVLICLGFASFFDFG